MKQTHKTTIVLLAVCAMAGYGANAQNLLLNGSFESPSVPTNIISATIPTSWSGSGPLLGMIHGAYGTLYPPLPQDGQQYVALGNSSSLSQVFTISSPGNFTLSWFDSSEFNGPGQFSPYQVIVTNSIGNTVMNASFDANASGFGVWTPHSIGLALAADTYTLSFYGNAGFFAERSLLDNVSLVPEPSSISVVLAAGLTAAGFRKLRRKYTVAR